MVTNCIEKEFWLVLPKELKPASIGDNEDFDNTKKIVLYKKNINKIKTKIIRIKIKRILIY